MVAGCSLDVGGLVSSLGLDPGGDLVHLEGCDVTITGTVRSGGAGHAVPSNPPNHCDGTFRPGKPANSTGCIEVWAHGNLLITGVLNADTGSAGGNEGISWIDLFAKTNITINGSVGGPYAVHADGLGGTGGNGEEGGIVTVKALNGQGHHERQRDLGHGLRKRG